MYRKTPMFETEGIVYFEKLKQQVLEIKKAVFLAKKLNFNRSGKHKKPKKSPN